jgi:hypothetical protein
MSEPTPMQCAEFGFKAIQTYVDATGCEENEPETQLCDLLADLMHWADQMAVSFGAAFATAERHYTEELAELEEPGA